MFMSKCRILTIVGIAGLAGLAATATPVIAAAAEPPGGSAATEEAVDEVGDCDRAAAKPSRDEGRVVYVGPRQNVRMRVGGDEPNGADAVACEAENDDVEVRTIYVGPRQNVPKRVVKDRSSES